MRAVIITAVFLLSLLGAGAARASWADYGFNSYDDCMAAVNDWASCNDGSQPDPNAPADPPPVGGCTNSLALNFNGAATFDDGSCILNSEVSPPAETPAPPSCTWANQSLVISWFGGASPEVGDHVADVEFTASLVCTSSEGMKRTVGDFEIDKDGLPVLASVVDSQPSVNQADSPVWFTWPCFWNGGGSVHNLSGVATGWGEDVNGVSTDAEPFVTAEFPLACQ